MIEHKHWWDIREGDGNEGTFLVATEFLTETEVEARVAARLAEIRETGIEAEAYWEDETRCEIVLDEIDGARALNGGAAYVWEIMRADDWFPRPEPCSSMGGYPE